MLGKYGVAVTDKAEGKSHIVKRADGLEVRVTSEWLGSGTPRREAHDEAEALSPGDAELVVAGDRTLENGLEKAVAEQSGAPSDP